MAEKIMLTVYWQCCSRENFSNTDLRFCIRNCDYFLLHDL